MTEDDPDRGEDDPAPPQEYAAKQARKAYCAPELVRLGSVRELTLGATGGLAEGAGTFIKPPM